MKKRYLHRTFNLAPGICISIRKSEYWDYFTARYKIQGREAFHSSHEDPIQAVRGLKRAIAERVIRRLRGEKV